jgi:hypothetical protein
MNRRLLVLLAFALAASACAPAMRPLSTNERCVAVATQQDIPCAALAEQRSETEQQEKRPPQGPGKKDFSTWMALLAMGFGALYLMAFK